MSNMAFPANVATLPSAMPRVRVLLVDDNDGFRESLAMLLDTEEMTVVGQAPNGVEALAMIGGLDPDVVLMDVRMPEMDGIETTRELKARFPSLGIVALTGSEDQRAVRDMLVAGASGYVLKDSDGDEILYAVRQAATGGGVLSPEVTPTVIEELTEALERERRRTRQLEIAQEALLERAARRHELISRLGHELRTPGHRDPRHGADAGQGHRASRRTVARSSRASSTGRTAWHGSSTGSRPPSRPGSPSGPTWCRSRARSPSGRDRVVIEAPEGPAMASLNRTAAHRVIEELVENALAFSPADAPVVVAVTLGASGPEVRVIDHGDRHRPRGDAPHLRAAGAGGAAQHPHPSGRRARAHPGAHVGQRDGRRRGARVDGTRGLDVPVGR